MTFLALEDVEESNEPEIEQPTPSVKKAPASSSRKRGKAAVVIHEDEPIATPSATISAGKSSKGRVLRESVVPVAGNSVADLELVEVVKSVPKRGRSKAAATPDQSESVKENVSSVPKSKRGVKKDVTEEAAVVVGGRSLRAGR